MAHHLALAVLAVLLIAGCSKGVPAATPVGDLRDQLTAFLQGDVPGYMRHVSADYADIHAEATDPGDRDELHASLASRFDSDEHGQRYGHWTVDAAFRFEDLDLLPPVDAPPEASGPGFSPRAGDVLVILPTVAEFSPDPWAGWYRAEATKWMQVAGD